MIGMHDTLAMRWSECKKQLAAARAKSARLEKMLDLSIANADHVFFKLLPKIIRELAAERAKSARLEKTIANLIEMNLTRICSLCPHGSPMCCREQNDCRTAVVKWLSEIQEFPEVMK
jgi:hypothetical protein